jgi:hypothetical protein
MDRTPLQGCLPWSLSLTITSNGGRESFEIRGEEGHYFSNSKMIEIAGKGVQRHMPRYLYRKGN